jgi:hypothetical protein
VHEQEAVPDTSHDQKGRKPNRNNYKMAALVCFANMIWKEYPDILKTELPKLSFFLDIHSYRNKKATDDKGRYKTINRWLNQTEPENIKINNRPLHAIKKRSLNQFKEMEGRIKPLESVILQILKDSIDYYNARDDQRKDMDEADVVGEIIDLDKITYMIKAKDSKIKDNDFWSNYLIDNNFTFEILERSKHI